MRRAYLTALTALLLLPQLATQARAQAEDGPTWVVYATEFGWLRVGTAAEFEERWERQREIWGGTSTEPLQKELLRGGFSTREAALEEVCSRLTRVRLTRHAAATPLWTVSALYEGEEYALRLDRGQDPDAVIFRGQEYDLDAEVAILREHGITPRLLVSAQYLCHVTGRDTREGRQDQDAWMCQPSEPEEGGFWIPDETGFSVHHFYTDIVEGPFLDSFSLAEVMRRHGVTSVSLWPTGQGTTLDAATVPEDPRDYGVAADPVQPLVARPEMSEWVVYATELQWLRVGTRTEFDTPRPRSKEIWAGTEDTPVAKTLLAEGYSSYSQAISAVCGELQRVRWQYIRHNEPHDIVTGEYQGTDYRLQLARDPDALVVAGLGYDFDAERALLAQHGITPMASFGEQWLVHSIQMGTMSGPTKTDRWMMVAAEPRDDAVVVPDGGGGGFVHSIDFAAGPFTDSFALAKTLRQKGVERVRLAAGEPSIVASWVPDDPRDSGQPPRPSTPQLTRVDPPAGRSGQTLYATLYGTDIEPGAEVTFGEGVQVTDLTYFGQDPSAGSPDARWLVSLRIAGDASAGPRDVRVTNADGGSRTAAAAFTVGAVKLDIAPFLRLISPHSVLKPFDADECAGGRAHQETKIEEYRALARKAPAPSGAGSGSDLRAYRSAMHEVLGEIEATERAYWEHLLQVMPTVTEDEIATLVGSLRVRSEYLFAQTQRDLDHWRERPFSPFDDSEYADGKRRYDESRESLLHTLRLWSTLNKALRERREVERAAARRLRAIGEPVDLRPVQSRLEQAFIMAGEISLYTEQTMAELSLQMQDSCGANLRAARAKVESTEVSDEWLKAGTHHAIVAAKYTVGSFNALFGGTVEAITQTWNDSWLSSVWEFETHSADIQKRLDESRVVHGRKVAGMAQLGAMSAEDLALMGAAIAEVGVEEYGQDALTLLDDDRLWFEGTDGGLLRLATCYDDSYREQTESEYVIMLRRAELTTRDMRQTLNVQMGADAKTGEFDRLRRLFNPMGIIRTYTAEELHGQYSSRDALIAQREDDTEDMRGLLAAHRKADFDLDRLGRYPGVLARHYRLKYSHADYLRWCLTAQRLASLQAQDDIAQLVVDEWDDSLRHALQREALLSKVTLLDAYDVARLYRLEAANRIILWDWAGAVECAERAAKTDARVQSPERVAELRAALSWERTTELGIETAEQLGNLGLFSAVTCVAGQLAGEGLHAAGINLGMAAPDAATMGAQARAGFFTRISTTEYWTGFADYVYGQVNPFGPLLTRAGEQGVVKDCVTEIAEEVVAPEIGRKVFVGWFGMDNEYADTLADLLVETAGTAREVNSTLALRDAQRLTQTRTRWQQYQANIDLYRERADGRADLVRGVRTLEWLAALERERDAVLAELAREAPDRDPQRLSDASRRLWEAERRLARETEPVTAHEAEEAARLLEEALAVRTTPEERLAELVSAVDGEYCQAVAQLYRQNPRDPVALRHDRFRREIVDIVCGSFMDRYAQQYGQHFVGFLVYGSAAHPDWASYRPMSSDFDITALLRTDTPEAARRQMESDFVAYFVESTGSRPEAYGCHFFADTLPALRQAEAAARLGGDVTELAETLAQDPDLARRMAEHDAEALRVVWLNRANPERFVLPGNTNYFRYLVRMAGQMYDAGVATDEGRCCLRPIPAGVGHYFGDVRFESWQGFDIVLGQFMQASRGREAHARDMFAYQRSLDRAALRVLAGRIIQIPQGLERLNGATPEQVAAEGGVEAFIARLGTELRTELELTPDEVLLIREWTLCKEGRPLGEVFEERAGARLLSGDPALGRHLADHVNQTEGFLLRSVGLTIHSQSAYLTQLMAAAPAQANDDARRALEGRARLIIGAQHAVWQRLRPAERRLVLRAWQWDAPYWRMIDVHTQLEAMAADEGGVEYERLSRWWPAFRDEAAQPELPPVPDVRHPFETPVTAG